VEQVVRVQEDLPENSSPDDVVLYHILNDVHPGVSTIEVVSDYTVRSGDVWLLVSASFENADQERSQIPLQRLVIIPEVPGWPEESYIPMGVAVGSNGYIGDPLARDLLLAPGAPTKVTLIYRVPLWWARAYRITWR
jgi:hypothetical protein